ncbi:hypothetical protein [Methanoregula sp.]|uniref:hypothetical protein n=1 Tax=Methanoregula sp. TaxID=2052170 RepID=UPI003561F81C
MNFSWQIARKIDRLDLGQFAATEFFYRNAILYGLIRAIDPKEKIEDDEDQPGQSIQDLISSVDDRIKTLLEFDTTAILMGHSNLPEVKQFQSGSMDVWFEIAEITHRCHLCDQVLYQIPEAP